MIIINISYIAVSKFLNLKCYPDQGTPRGGSSFRTVLDDLCRRLTLICFTSNMHFKHTSLLLSAVVFITIWTSLCDGDSIMRYMTIVEDTGYATNCGKVPFNFSWTPKTLSARHSVDIEVDYRFLYELDGGFYNLTVTEYGETKPFIVSKNPFTCDDIKEFITCPIPIGFLLKIKKTFTDTSYLMGFPGRFIVTAEVKNKEGQQMVCAKLDITDNNN
ncbi:hypothetical protein RRG08_038759 [Elysia crispata]|uniref:MD-2-related lipid-recognition domain-containing protein n=1 Tax=Elysia crispata TaxID=231223 RepID=A0AAE1ANS3_9GAST|nr:hypothetical protein RRG08_038759 [Elysia crispata]